MALFQVMKSKTATSTMAKAAGALAILLALPACGSKSSGGDGGVAAQHATQADLKPVNDRSTCGTGATASSIEGTWGLMFASDNQEFKMMATFDFDGQRLTATNVCSFGGRSLTVAAHAPYTQTSRQVSVLAEDSESNSIDDGGFHLDCNVSLKPATISYRAYGSCLILSQDGNPVELTLVRESVLHSQPGQPQPTAPHSQPGPGLPAPLPGQPTQPPLPLPAPPTPGTGHSTPAPLGQWACTLGNRSTNDVYIGYGASQFAAAATAKQSCRATTDGYYCDESQLVCGQQEGLSEAWFCEVENRSTSQVYTATGHSESEATYLARKGCFNGKPEAGYYCAKGAEVKCVHQI